MTREEAEQLGVFVLSISSVSFGFSYAATQLRPEAEKELIFAGFIAFECLVRKDSALVVGALNESGHKAGSRKIVG